MSSKMTIEMARKIWGDIMTDEELQEWAETVNKRSKEFTTDKEDKGETILVNK